MTTLGQIEYREKHGFPDIKIPKELELDWAMGGEVFASRLTKLVGEKDVDVEVSMILHRPNKRFRLFVYESGFGGCCLMDKLTNTKDPKEALKILDADCERIFKQKIKLSFKSLPDEIEFN